MLVLNILNVFIFFISLVRSRYRLDDYPSARGVEHLGAQGEAVSELVDQALFLHIILQHGHEDTLSVLLLIGLLIIPHCVLNL